MPFEAPTTRIAPRLVCCCCCCCCLLLLLLAGSAAKSVMLGVFGVELSDSETGMVVLGESPVLEAVEHAGG